MQTTDHVLMVRPVRFAFNEETAANNAFQQKSEDSGEVVARRAIEEFDAFVALLRAEGVTVDVVQDTPEPFTPDSIFPNNCFSTHRPGDGQTVVLYPMFAANRRLERAKLAARLKAPTAIDLTGWEAKGLFLEGTGSLILDREHRRAYACRSPRTSEEVADDWARRMGYECFLFDSADENGVPVYHTNVVMHVGTRFAVVCLESVANEQQREKLVSLLEGDGKEIVSISFAQMHQFAGNMLELRSAQGEKLLVMSQTARASLTAGQTSRLEQDVRIVAPDIHTIEQAGGGSARCMLAEIF